MKKFLSVILTFVMCFGVFVLPATADETVTLTMLVDASRAMEGFEAVAALAEEKLGIVIEVEPYPGGETGDSIIKTRLASGEVPDLLCYNSGSLLAALNPTDYFIDLSDQPWVRKIDETFKASATVGNEVFGIPFSSSNAGVILYNIELYEKYGLSVPATWDEFLANCQILKDADEVAIIGSFADSWTSQLIFLGDYYNVQAEDPAFVSEFEAGVAKYATSPAALASFRKLQDTIPFYDADAMANTYADAGDLLINGEGAHWPMLTQTLSNLYGLYGDDVNKIGVFGVPGDDPENHGLTVWMPNALYGNKNSEHIDKILEFMEFYISDEALDAYTGQLLPDGPYCVIGYNLPENVYQGVKDMQPYFDAGRTAAAMEFSTPVKGPNCASICTAIVSGQMTAEEGADQYDKDCLKQALQLGLDW